MAGFWDRILRRKPKPPGSAAKAKERLKFVLVHDRINMPPGNLQAMKEEIFSVISKYVAVAGAGSEEIEIVFKQRDRHSSMLMEIPFLTSLQQQEEPDSTTTPTEATQDGGTEQREAVSDKQDEQEKSPSDMESEAKEEPETDTESETETEEDEEKETVAESGDEEAE